MSPELLLARTKILVPQRRAELLRRNRLLDMLTDLLDFKLIIIAAPAGYGKTSLLIDFIHYYHWPVCWLSLDSLDQDPVRFISYFIAAIEQRFNKFGSSSWQALRQMPPEELNLNHLVATISNDIFDNISEHFIIVLDDYHLLNENAVIDQFLSDFLQRADENCHLIINSRRLLTLPDLPLMVARSQVGGLSVEELAFLPDEIQKLYAQNLKRSISLEEAENLAQQSEGWITGLLLTSQMMKQGLGDRLKVERTSGVGLYEYLSEQVLEQQPGPLQKFLLRSSLLEEFDSEMCAEVIGKPLGISEDWEQMMELAMRNNVFVLPVGEDHLWLRYHHLFSDFLQERVRRDEPDISEKIQHSLAEYFIKRQDWDKSFSIYQKLNEIEALACLVEKVGSDFIALGRMNKLAEWLNVLDEQSIKRHPAITALQASVAVNKGNPQDGLVFFNKLVGTLNASNQTELLADNLVRRSSTRRLMGDYAGSIEDADRAIEICQGKDDYVLILAEAMRAKGSTLYQQGKWREALDWLEKSLKIYKDHNRGQDIARIQVEIGVVADALGNYSAAEKAYQESLRYWQSVGDSMWQANLLNNLGFLQHSIGEFETAFSNLEKALQYANLNGNLRMEGYALASIGDLYRDLEAYQEAEDAFQKASQIAKLIKDTYLYFLIKLAQVRVQIDLGRFRQAESILRSALQLAKQDTSKNEMIKYRLENGLLQLFLRNFPKAADELSTAAQYFSAENHLDDLIRAQFILAVADYESGELEKSIELFKNAASRLNQPRARVKILTSACELESMLNGIIEKGGVGEPLDIILNEMEGFRNRLHDCRQQIRKRATAVSFTPPKITLRAFGRTEVLINHHKLTNAEWKSQNARDLLFLFLSHPQGLTKEEVGLHFWPDLSPVELKLRFKNAIYRLRHAAGNDIVVFHDNYYLFNRALDYEYDVQSFNTDLERAQTEKNVQKKISYLQSAISKYGGTYLSDVEEDWPAADRRKYADQYLKALLDLSTIFYGMKNYENAKEVVQIALAADDCSEEAYRLGMQINSAMGNMGEVKRIFQKCVDSLKAEMGIEPSPKTRQIYENLTIYKIENVDGR